MSPSRRDMVADTVLGGETASLLDMPRAAAGAREDAFSRAFETGAGKGYTGIEERSGAGAGGEQRKRVCLLSAGRMADSVVVLFSCVVR